MIARYTLDQCVESPAIIRDGMVISQAAAVADLNDLTAGVVELDRAASVLREYSIRIEPNGGGVMLCLSLTDNCLSPGEPPKFLGGGFPAPTLALAIHAAMLAVQKETQE